MQNSGKEKLKPSGEIVLKTISSRIKYEQLRISVVLKLLETI